MAPKVTASALCLGMAAIYSFFGVTLMVAPKTCWGPDSPLSYWGVMDASGIWFGRAVGIWMTAVTLSPYYAGISKSTLAKVYLPINLATMVLFVQAAFYMPGVTGPGKNALLPFSLWLTQVPIAAVLTIMNLILVQPKMPAMPKLFKAKPKAAAKTPAKATPTRSKSPAKKK